MGELTQRIETDLRRRIDSGDFQDGGRLPSERELAASYTAGRTTIRLILTRLTAEGLLVPRHGKGYFVRSVVDADAAEGR